MENLEIGSKATKSIDQITDELRALVGTAKTRESCIKSLATYIGENSQLDNFSEVLEIGTTFFAQCAERTERI